MSPAVVSANGGKGALLDMGNREASEEKQHTFDDLAKDAGGHFVRCCFQFVTSSSPQNWSKRGRGCGPLACEL